MILRPYQQGAVDALWDYFAHKQGNPLVAMPTGTGKSLVIGAFVRSALQAYPRTRVMMLTHVKELIQQNMSKLLELWPTAPAGIYSAGLGRRDTTRQVTFAGIASVAKRAQAFAPPDIVVVDEAHLVSHRGETMYRKFLGELLERNPKMKVVGLSATCYRLGLGELTSGGIFTDVAYDLTQLEQFNDLIAQGYLAPLHAVRTGYRLDVGDVRVSAGEYVARDLQDALDRDAVTDAALTELVRMGEHRKRWLVFASGVAHAEHIADWLTAAGVAAVPVHSKLDKDTRAANYTAFKQGRVRCAVSMNAMTTGIDVPEIDLIGMLRPTRSTSLWVQMLGRGTRPCAGKTECLVADFTDNTATLGPINDPVLPVSRNARKRKVAAPAPVRACPQCLSYVHAALGDCPHCGYHFPVVVKIHEGSAGLDVLRKTREEPVVEALRVTHVTYRAAKRRARAPVFVASYHCAGEGNVPRRYQDFVCLEHTGAARKYAERWWKRRSNAPVPDTVERALDLSPALRTPTLIKVWTNKPQPEIMDYEYA